MSLFSLYNESNRALTFKIEESIFGIDIENILSFSDSYEEIKFGTHNIAGFIGYLDFQGSLVKVFDCATALSHKRESDTVLSLIEEIKTYRQSHIDWVDALENSIVSDTPFILPTNPERCAFGRWFYSFETKDESVLALLSRVEEPHNHIHALADKLLTMVKDGQRTAAIDELRIERQITLQKLIRTLDSICEYLLQSIHPIVLHLSEDGKTPWFSLALDEIGEIVEYSAVSMDTIEQLDQKEPIKAYVRDPSGTNFMLLSLDRFYEQIVGKVDIAG